MKQVYIRLPGLFEKFDLIKRIIELKNKYPYIFKKGYFVDSIYGSNGGTLNGGRSIKSYDKNVKDVLIFCKQYHISPMIVMNNKLTSYDLAENDTYANLIIDNIDMDDTYFCISNDDIKKWLLDKGAKINNLISSTTKCLNFEDIEEESKNYNLVVLPERFINRFDLIEKLPLCVRKKLEVIINNACPLECTKRKDHYDYMSKLALGEKLPAFICPNCSYAGNGFLYELIDTQQFVNTKKINRYLELGINHFKIQGRTDDDYNLIETFAYYMIKDMYKIMFRELMQKQ